MQIGHQILFSQTELEAIKNTINECEKDISGEIRVAYEDSSNNYGAAGLIAGLIFMWTASLLFILVEELLFSNSFMALFQDHYLLLIQGIAFLLGILITSFSDKLKRTFTPKKYLRKSVLEKAETIFLEKEIFATRQRSGILIFMSILEHQIVILPDIGLKAKVSAKEWDKITKNIANSFKKHQAADGIQQAIRECRDILLKNGFEAGPDDINELSNEVIVPKK